jgi:hypothetical protein
LHCGRPLLTKPDGSTFDSDSLGIWFADAIEQAGLPDPVRYARSTQDGGTHVGRGRPARAQNHGHYRPPVFAEIERYTRAATRRRRKTPNFWGRHTQAGTEPELQVANTPTREWQKSDREVEMIRPFATAPLTHCYSVLSTAQSVRQFRSAKPQLMVSTAYVVAAKRCPSFQLLKTKRPATLLGRGPSSHFGVLVALSEPPVRQTGIPQLRNGNVRLDTRNCGIKASLAFLAREECGDDHALLQ